MSTAGSERDRTVTHVAPLALTLIVTLTPISDCYAPMPVTLTLIVTLTLTLIVTLTLTLTPTSDF